MKAKLLYIATLLMLLSSSCKREFEDNLNFTEDIAAEVYGDNQLLFSKIFQFATGSTYLWFDIRNEIANFSKPAMNLTYVLNPEGDPSEQLTMIKRIDLRGMLYSYDAEKEELTILDYPLDIATGTDIPADIVFSFFRKQKDGCELTTDPNQRRQCERTFVLQIDRIEFKEIDFVVPVETVVNYDLRTLRLQNLTLELFLTN
ncbi:hypothetical protein H8B06_00920 [Sphingobacterium sp. DN00404]|uniref:Uncharacterized protein n=1 Tax=Sphingobacterium micropteri TaxID=2763501 RepID=A0ABR7YJ68_9SPHI|nr:hypothetical protein [Sphingobacterium micropteri]MBD1431372.1 hypothetical protein [Sphingobacterium micropteri]